MRKTKYYVIFILFMAISSLFLFKDNVKAANSDFYKRYSGGDMDYDGGSFRLKYKCKLKITMKLSGKSNLSNLGMELYRNIDSDDESDGLVFSKTIYGKNKIYEKVVTLPAGEYTVEMESDLDEWFDDEEEEIEGEYQYPLVLSGEYIPESSLQKVALEEGKKFKVKGTNNSIKWKSSNNFIANVDNIADEKTISVDQVYFPDEVFRGYIREFADTNGDGTLSQAEIVGVTSMDVSGKGIANLKGIEFFSELEELYCSGNHLVELDVTTLTKLKTLVCENNRITATVDANNEFTLPFTVMNYADRVKNLIGAFKNGNVFTATAESVSYSFDAGNTFSVTVFIQVNKFRKDISKATVQAIPDADYTGKAIEPKITLIFQGKRVPTANYTVTYKNNVNAGTAKVEISGINNFTGMNTAVFTIHPKNISRLSFSKISDKVYMGKGIKPPVTVKDKGRELKVGLDYTATYRNNKKTGKACIEIRGKGNYKGTKTITFKIVPEKVSSFKKRKVTATSVTLKWKKCASITGYQIFQYNPKTKKYRQIKKTGARITSVTIKKLSPYTIYRFKIRAYKKSGKTMYYGKYSSILKVETKLSAPSIKVSSNWKGQAVVSWNKVTNASGLEISYRKDKGKYKVINSKLKNKKDTMYLHGLMEGIPYTFRMRAYRTKKGKKIYSDYSRKTIVISSRKAPVQGDWIGGLQIAQNVSQIIVVAANGNAAVVSMHNKNSNGSWTEILSVNGNIGRNGIGKTAEGDGKTPQGIYGFSVAFGIQPNPGTVLPYTQVDASYYWVDDPNSVYYNQFVSINNVVRDWRSAEHIAGIGNSYNYVLAINYNSACVPGVGSAIFLHCNPKGGTSGCIAIPESSMITILQNIRPDCILIIDSTNGVYNY